MTKQDEFTLRAIAAGGCAEECADAACSGCPIQGSRFDCPRVSFGHGEQEMARHMLELLEFLKGVSLGTLWKTAKDHVSRVKAIDRSELVVRMRHERNKMGKGAKVTAERMMKFYTKHEEESV